MEVKKNSFKAWVLAARPKTLTGAAVPVMIGLSLAWKDSINYIGHPFSCTLHSFRLYYAD